MSQRKQWGSFGVKESDRPDFTFRINLYKCVAFPRPHTSKVGFLTEGPSLTTAPTASLMPGAAVCASSSAWVALTQQGCAVWACRQVKQSRLCLSRAQSFSQRDSLSAVKVELEDLSSAKPKPALSLELQGTQHWTSCHWLKVVSLQSIWLFKRLFPLTSQSVPGGARALNRQHWPLCRGFLSPLILET